LSDVNRRLASAKGILFDLDNTLYPSEKGVFDRINERINDYVREFTRCAPPFR
jgi:FMN phosphatase YigB (HAD superfamily)